MNILPPICSRRPRVKPLGTGGSSTLYQTDCEGTLRQWRVSAFVEYGSGYRIEQWVPQTDFDRWSQSFLDMLTRFEAGQPDPINVTAPTVDNSAASVESAPAPIPPLPMAHLFVGDVFTGTLDNMPGHSVTAIPTLVRRYLTFSPDGLYLAFMDTTGTQIRSLNVNEQRNSRPVTEDVDPDVPAVVESGQPRDRVCGGNGYHRRERCTDL